jgi:flagellar protein FliJ
MKKFSFGLETLLQHRIRLEENEKNRFTKIRAELQTELKHKETIAARQKESRSELGHRQEASCDPEEIGWYLRYLTRLDMEIKRSIERIVELEKHVDAQRQIMVEASRNKQMIENLKKKKHKEHIASAEREERKSIDEMVVTRFALKQ